MLSRMIKEVTNNSQHEMHQQSKENGDCHAVSWKSWKYKTKLNIFSWRYTGQLSDAVHDRSKVSRQKCVTHVPRVSKAEGSNSPLGQWLGSCERMEVLGCGSTFDPTSWSKRNTRWTETEREVFMLTRHLLHYVSTVFSTHFLRSSE